MRFTTTLRRGATTAAVATAALLASAVPAAAAAPSTPVFGTTIDAYAAYDPQNTCDPVAKPGVIGFRELALRQYPSTGDSGIVRSCTGDTEVTEHKEGRAWDWTINAGNTADHARADELLAWLLATDSRGNQHANARRLGIMYIIFDHRIWGSYQAGDGWRTYTGSNPHTDHVHFSFSRAGAAKQTTWWTQVDQPAAWPRTERGANGANVQVLQHLLNAAGQSITVDGDFGPATETAVKAFQSANGATADGIVGMVTWSKLLKQVSRGSQGSAVKAAQVALNKGGAGLTVDGDFGSGTQAAVNAYQSAHDRTAGGVVDPTLWQLLIAGIA
ncbi:peptidoglycan-binding domain-containing protein [Catenuloplanes japonicus]|uniref:peptidoglycan-binding domain-containing protein n=1 Tax=Catenuloplanes japonicus TaxID=33876 RepID=UPI0012FBC287|nr:peptidoglycan-binding protein [Catenuloplanes japonicus]